ncbi:MAG: IS256 family transposase, partial [Selenomonadaceae bacterium]|nr:IS256 family transposase [Selenomonadaceae bacterium]
TPNAIEALNSSLGKVRKGGAFPNDNSVFKLLYLRVVELQKKCASRPVANWSLVRNQLLMNDRLAALFDKFDR